MNNRKIRIGITHGDTNGIGYEVILKTLEDARLADLCTITVYGSAKAAAFYRKGMELAPVQFNKVENASAARDGAFNIVNVVGEDLKIEPGVASEAAGQAAFAALEAAMADLQAGNIDVLVTAPINKHSIQSKDFNFPGHTEYLENCARREGDNEARSLMILCSDTMRVALVTTHTSIAEVPAKLSKELIDDKIKAFSDSLRRDFGIPTPRIGVLSLNPHAGEEGLLGKEETEIIAPAIADARQKKILAFGPYAPDGFFGSGAYRAFDGILAMYHDQGLIPFKTLAMDSGVNFTAGLPFVRTSPDHGTGYDIAGKGQASPESMRCAIYAAIDIFRNRINHDEAYRRPLARQINEKPEKNDRADKNSSPAPETVNE